MSNCAMIDNLGLVALRAIQLDIQQFQIRTWKHRQQVAYSDCVRCDSIVHVCNLHMFDMFVNFLSELMTAKILLM